MEEQRKLLMTQYVAWLRDAHAMEEQAVTMLRGMASRIEHYPELRARVESHIAESERQSQSIAQCLHRHGQDPSTLKDTGAKFMATMQAMSGAMADDEVVKGVLFSYSFEHMEIASYRILHATAKRLGDTETAQVCENILREEEAMAKWLFEHMDALTNAFLDRVGQDLVAKR